MPLKNKENNRISSSTEYQNIFLAHATNMNHSVHSSFKKLQFDYLTLNVSYKSLINHSRPMYHDKKVTLHSGNNYFVDHLSL